MFDTFAFSKLISRIPPLLRKFGPYAALEILLPGGSLLALALWLLRRHRCRALKAGGPLLRKPPPEAVNYIALAMSSPSTKV